jgi:hypothetical protein
MNYEKAILCKRFPELTTDTDYIDKYLIKKHGYRPPKSYAELVAVPRPDQLPPKIQKRKYNRDDDDIKIAEDQF